MQGLSKFKNLFKMNVFIKVLLYLCVFNLLYSIVYCDDTIEISCSSDHDCKSFEDKFVSSYCNSKSTCSCIYRKNNEEIKCIPKNVKKTNLLNVQKCTIPNTELKDGRCVATIVHLGRSCDFSEQCMRYDKNSECIEGSCSCKENFMEKDNMCRSLIKIEKCTEDEQCKSNAECYKEKCVCNKGFITAANFSYCLEFGVHNKPCVESIQCKMGLGDGGICEDDLCRCNSGYTIIKNELNEHVCAKNVYAEDPCSSDSDCKIDAISKMICENEKCSCLNGFIMIESSDKKVCVKNDARVMELSSKGFSLNQSCYSFLITISFIMSLFYCTQFFA